MDTSGSTLAKQLLCFNHFRALPQNGLFHIPETLGGLLLEEGARYLLNLEQRMSAEQKQLGKERCAGETSTVYNCVLKASWP